jgi:hypothetical protein
MNGEETSGGRAFAHALDGTSWELPRLGKLAFENAGARRGGFAQTVVISQDDTSGSGGVANGEVYVYSVPSRQAARRSRRRGSRTAASTESRFDDSLAESRTDGFGAASRPFSLYSFGNVENWSGATLQTAWTGTSRSSCGPKTARGTRTTPRTTRPSTTS